MAAKKITLQELKELYPGDPITKAYVKYILSLNHLSREDKIKAILGERNRLLVWLAQANAHIVYENSLVDSPDPDYESTWQKRSEAVKSLLTWVDMRILELSSAVKLNFLNTEEEKDTEHERVSILETRDQFILMFLTLKECGILPIETEQKQIAFFINQVMGFSQAKIEQSFSAYRRKDNRKLKRQNARTVIMALEKAIDLLKSTL